ncbi:WD40/YVTN/BNR-like repeat-containing protein [Pseudomonas sp. N040]|uniref:WD40/YVTN/BNR-like repeat-containing protein n=1 Tax=Pseudomonas sp. N040 TaxID=2785325 RepID=UPI0018A2B974|nr:YCF48-related protein [Pseudomonas sp. N040]MBF7729137.1 glycosyl hydrolase [Pseudomonas sp. N040]MBW7012777.1 glycosyl hydrolase [Pseudomonas sp. N040]
MPAFNPLRRAVAALCLASLASLSSAADTASVPDLLDLPAQHNARAQTALQLAVAQAGERLVAVGERGAVLLSDDQGRSWRQAGSVPVSVLLTDVDFVSASHGWAVGHSGVILHSSDGGETWQRQLDGRQAAQIILDDARQRLAAGEEGAAAAVRSAEFLVSDGPDKPFLGVHFSDALHGYAVGAYGIAVVTADGGNSWQSLVGRIPNPRGKHLYQVQAGHGQLLVAGEQGALFRSTDGGVQFSEVRTPYPGTFFGALSVDDNTLLAYGLRGNAWRSTDGGASWEHIGLPHAVTLTAGLRLQDGSWLLADESGGFLRSSDAGRTFVALQVQAGAGLSGILEAADGALIISGSRGLSRIEPDAVVAGN